MAMKLSVFVEWDGEHLWITEENGSGCKYSCDSADEISKCVDDYVKGFILVADFEEKEANRDVY